MAPELGVFALILAFCLSVAQAFFALAGAWRGKPVWMSVARPAVTGQFVFVVVAFACLVYSFVNNDFSVLYVARKPGDLEVRFVLTDFAHQIPVEYSGVLPDLFREGQGIIAHGTLGTDGGFVADEVLAKHDEKYMPPEVAASLKNKSAANQPGAKPIS